MAELALLGIKYRSLGGHITKLDGASLVEKYWTGKRMAEKAVKDAVRAWRRGDRLASQKVSEAIGTLQALCNCSVIDQETYMGQWKLIRERKPG
jgi:DNA-binding transcriptional ArsR family regulator